MSAKVIARWAVFGALALMLAGLVGPPACAQDGAVLEGQDFERLHEAYLADPDLQLERPEPQPAEPPAMRSDPGWLVALSQVFGDILRALGPLFRILFYVLIGGLVLWLLYFLFGEALNLRLDRFRKPRDGPIDSHAEPLRPDAAAARSLLEEADALAREGRFAEAVHLLLFRSIEDIQTRKSGGVPRSLTAREIGRLADLPEAARATLAPIITVVERSFFGGRAVDETGWQRARTSYERFAFGESW